MEGRTSEWLNNTAALRSTAYAVAPDGVETVLYEGLVDLPHLNPDEDVDQPQPQLLRCAAVSGPLTR